MRFLFSLMLVLVIATAVLIPSDQKISHFIRTSPAIQQNEALTEWMGVVMVFGKGNILFLLALAVGSCGLKRRAIEMVMALLLSALLVWPVKLTVQRERPDESNRLSFPSADAAAAAASAVPLAAWSLKIIPAGGLVVLSVAGSRIFFGSHYPSDVCAGMALGLLAGMTALKLNRRWRWSPSWRYFVVAAGFFYLSHTLLGLFDLGGDLSGEPVLRYLKIFGLVILLIFTARFIRVFLRRHRLRNSVGISETTTFHEQNIKN